MSAQPLDELAFPPRTPLGDTPHLQPTDGRRVRREATTARMTMACRVLMRRGDFRPTAVAVATEAHVSLRTVFQAFGDEPIATTPMDTVYQDGSVQPLLVR